MLSPVDRILARIVVTPSGCWLWTGSRTSGAWGSYGTISADGRQTYTHRLMYAAFVAPIPAGYVVDHLCRATLCCNPIHLEAVTPSENNLRGSCGFTLTGRCKADLHDVTIPGSVGRDANGRNYCAECRKARNRRAQIRRRARSLASRPSPQGTPRQGTTT